MTWRSTCGQTARGFILPAVLVSISTLLIVSACGTPQPNFADGFAQSEDALTAQRRLASVQSTAPRVPGNRMSNSHGALASTDFKQIFNRLFAINMSKTVDSDQLETVRAQSLYYSKENFNSTYKHITDSKTSEEAYRRRQADLEFNDANQRALSGPIYFSVENEQTGEFRKLIENARLEYFSERKNYFDTKMGKKVSEIFKDSVLVVIPGFGSHTIPDYTWPEIVSAANQKHDRATSRQDAVANPYLKFYASNKDVGFDVVHPMGNELGFSMGRDKDSADKLATWLINLHSIPGYAGKKWILLGYSKGAPIAQNLLVNHPEIRKDILAIVTMAGVNQGAVPAETALNKIRSFTRADDLEPFVNNLRKDPLFAAALIRNRFNGILGIDLDGIIQNALNAGKNTLGLALGAYVDFNALQTRIYDLGSTFAPKVAANAYYKVFYGIEDMSIYNRAVWNLENLNDDKIDKPISIFNISAIANIADFMLPNGLKDDAKVSGPLIIPQLKAFNQIENTTFSRDDLFLYLTSFTGFRQSPAGLFDTQVAWLDTKSIALDSRKLSESLDAKGLSRLRNRLRNDGYDLPDGFENMPRTELLYQLHQGKMENLNFIDLGDLRATHWDLAFEQIYKPKNTQNYYRHRFPRRALQASVLETLALYRLMGGLQQ